MPDGLLVWEVGFSGNTAFPDDELALYDAASRRVLTDDCREWLENGGHP